MRIVFMGTPDFAVPPLQALLDAPAEMGLEVAGVFTQPDRPRGRGKKVQASPVKQLAEKYGLPVFQPERIRRDGVEDLRALAPDLCVTAAFGQILSQEVLDIPRLGTVNVHASLLPRHRGSAPIAWAILQGDPEVGVTTMLTDAGIDTGAMLLSRSIPRPPEATCGELTETLSRLGAELLVETIRGMQAGTVKPVPQEEAAMTYDPKLTKELAAIDWSADADTVCRLVQAMNPWPCCTVPWQEGRLKLLRAVPCPLAGEAGTVLRADSTVGLVIACGSGSARITELQAPGGRAMQAADWLRGHSVPEGHSFAEEKPGGGQLG